MATMSMKKVIEQWLQGVAAGMCIGMGTITYLICTNKLLGAFIFAFGLFLVCGYKLKLCTGMAGYLFDKTTSTEGFVPAAIGNINGITLMYLLATLWKPELKLISNEILQGKLKMEYHQMFISAMFCGMLMFIAVDGYKNRSNSIGQYLSIFLAVPCFIINGFDHCVVSMFYVLSASSFEQGFSALIFFSIAMVGNFVGAIIIYWLFQHSLIFKRKYDK